LLDAPKPTPAAPRGYLAVDTMARPTKELPVRSSIVPAAVRRAVAVGMDADTLALRFGLPADTAAREEVAAATQVADELMHAIAHAAHGVRRGPKGAAASGEVSLQVAAELTGRCQTLITLAVRASADAKTVLERVARWAPLLHEGLEAALESGTGESEARWVLRTPRRPRGLGRYVHEVAIVHAVCRLREVFAGVAIHRAWFAHARPPDLDALAEWLGTAELAFGREESGFAVGIQALGVLNQAADARTVEAIAPLVESELEARRVAKSFAQRVAAHVAAALPASADVAEVASALKMSPRTLQRRLEQEQTNFSEVLDDARFEVARRLLADSAVTLTDAALRLGFADLATFSRAFKRWTGVPPGQWRRS
jgi:AraC-like DNA-binding protein